MVRCRYCDGSFDDDEALLSHLASEHDPAELSRIDRRRVEGVASAGGDGVPVGTIAGVGIGAVVIVGMLAAVVLLGGAGDGPVHEHGLMEVTIDGESFDFANDPALINADPAFHFHGGNHVWHVHAEGVTLAEALATIGIEVAEGGTVLEYDGEVYDDADPDTTVSITVNGEPVDPSEHVLEGVPGETVEAAAEGDHVVVVVERDD